MRKACLNKILILEDHPDVQCWVIQMCQAAFPRAEIKAVTKISDAIDLIHFMPDLLMADLNLPDGRGDYVISKFKAFRHEIACVVLTSFDDDEHLFSALKAGADGYLLKDQEESELLKMLKGIIKGSPPLSPNIALKLMHQFQPSELMPMNELLALSSREKETLSFISKGYSAKETARFMDISPHTVSGYIKEIYRKLHINSRAEAASFALKYGLS